MRPIHLTRLCGLFLFLLPSFWLAGQCDPNFSISNSNPCGGEAVQFEVDNPSPGYTYVWFINNVLVDTAEQISHRFPRQLTEETYPIELQVSGPDSCLQSGFGTVTVAPTPDIAVSGTFNRCLPSNSPPTQFEAEFTVSPPSGTYVWVFGANDTVAMSGPAYTITRTYPGFGSYSFTVSQTIGGCSDTYQGEASFFSRPSADMSIMDGNTDLCEGDTLEVENGTTSLVSYFVYDWGDGHRDTIEAPSLSFQHTYHFEDDEEACSVLALGQQQFDVTLIAIAAEGCMHENKSPVYVTPKPRPSFDAEGCLCVDNGLATFTNTSCSSGYSEYLWDFGVDDSTSTAVSTMFEYNEAGTYTVSLVATSLLGCGSTIVSANLEVVEHPAAMATIPADMEVNCGPVDIPFTNQSVGECLSYQWSAVPETILFVDSTGQSIDSIGEHRKNPIIRFLEPGSYTVTLATTNACGTDIWQQQVVIATPPEVALDSVRNACEILELLPSATISDGYCGDYSCHWQVADQSGNVAISFTDCEPDAVAIAQPGDYMLILAVTNCCDTRRDTAFFTIQAPISGVDAGADTTLCAGAPLDFTGRGSPGPGTWLDESGNPIDEFNTDSAGTYLFTYRYGAGLCEASDEMVVTVLPLPDAGIAPFPGQLCIDAQPFYFTGIPDSGQWLPPVEPSGYFDPQMAGGGTHYLAYTFTDDSGCSDTAMDSIIVGNIPEFSLPDVLFHCLNGQSANLESLLGITELPGDTTTWTGQGISDEATGFFLPDTAGRYGPIYFEYITKNGCRYEDSLFIEAVPLTPAEVNPDTTLCVSAGTLELISNLPGAWTGPGIEGGGVNLQVAASEPMPATYSFVAFEGESCETRDSFELTVVSVGAVDAGPDVYACESEMAANLMGTAPPGAFGHWTGLSLSDTVNGVVNIAPLAPDTYTYVYFADADALPGCRVADSTHLVIYPETEPGFVAPATACPEEAIQLDNTSENANVYSWDFGLPPASTEFEPSISYSIPDDYTITLTTAFEAPNGARFCTQSIQHSIHITAPPESVAFTLEPDTVCADTRVGLANESMGESLSFEWWVDGTLRSTEPDTFSISFPADTINTIHHIELRAANACGEKRDTNTVYVTPLPRARFGFAKNTFCSGEVLDFNNNSSGGPNTYTWIFEGLEPDPVFMDSLPEQIFYLTDTLIQRQIKLIVVNDCGIDSMVTTINIRPSNAHAYFNVDPVEVCLGEPICVTNLAALGADVSYDFGDDNGSTTADNACYTYREPGTYTITQTAESCGFDTQEIEVSVRPAPEAAAAGPPFACQDRPVQFENHSLGAQFYEWVFPPQDSLPQAAPEYTFNDITGPVDIIMTATNEYLCSDSDTISITIGAPPVPGFTFPNSICAGTPVRFTNTSMGAVHSCTWSFDSAECNPTHTFPSGDATYPVTLTVADTQGCAQSITQGVYVLGLPQVGFDYALDSPACTPAQVAFQGLPGADGYTWYVNGDPVASAPGFAYTFETAALYTVELVGSNDGICFDTAQATIEILPSPEASFQVDPPEGCAPHLAAFTNTSTGGGTANWDFMVGSSPETDPEFLFQEPGLYEVVLVMDANGCRDTARREIEVFQPVRISLSAQGAACNGENSGAAAVTVGNGTAPYQYRWSNGGMAPVQENLSAGSYSCTVTDRNGCEAEGTVAVTEPAPIQMVTLSEKPVSCFGGNDGAFEVQAVGGTPGYVLQWENGITGPRQEGLPAGNYALTITDAQGCSGLGNFTLRENPRLFIVDSLRHVSCLGLENGVIRILSIGGGVGDYFTEAFGPDGYVQEGRVFGNLRPGYYDIIVTDSLGCTERFEREIFDGSPVSINIIEDTLLMELGEEERIKTEYVGINPSFSWFPETDLDCIDCSEPVVSPKNDRTYVATITDAEGLCYATDTLYVELKKSRGAHFPNAFTPNSDGENDLFRPRTGDPGLESVLEFTIFDRWGEVVYRAEDFNPIEAPLTGWDGTGLKGEEMPPGVYVWTANVRYTDGVEIQYKGNVTLIR